jgi:hypothetical protein
MLGCTRKETLISFGKNAYFWEKQIPFPTYLFLPHVSGAMQAGLSYGRLARSSTAGRTAHSTTTRLLKLTARRPCASDNAMKRPSADREAIGSRHLNSHQRKHYPSLKIHEEG